MGTIFVSINEDEVWHLDNKDLKLVSVALRREHIKRELTIGGTAIEYTYKEWEYYVFLCGACGGAYKCYDKVLICERCNYVVQDIRLESKIVKI